MIFEPFFQWSMRNAARILFLIALLTPVTVFGPWVLMMFHQSASVGSDLGDFGVTPTWYALFRAFAVLPSLALPFFGAALVHLAQQFVAGRSAIGHANPASEVGG